VAGIPLAVEAAARRGTRERALGGLGAAHEAVLHWCAGQGLAVAGPRWETYGHWHEDPARLETDVFWLLREG
jgi:hypothetical protein